VTVLDDADKGSMGSTASGYSGDGGTSQEMIQMLLTEMDGLDDDSGCVFVFTMNRVANCPPELLRPGRMDELWYVERPCPATRLGIMKVHLAHHKFTVDDDAKLETLAGDKFTDDWVGAELAKLITDGVLEAIAEKRDTVSTAFLAKRISEMTPMANVKTFQDDLRAIEEAAGQFNRVGRLTPKKSATAVTPSHGGRAGRPVRV
jgi:SpoVK/Ycf46/Vps4 family AAA+-type ATPase